MVGMVQGIKALREAEENLRQGRLHNQVIGLPHRAGGVGRTLNGRSGRPWQEKSPAGACRRGFERIWWRFRDLNPGPADYDSVALTN
ncbi:MAG: hypothetical protein RL227_1552 [Pseudomonadota bacterium]